MSSKYVDAHYDSKEDLKGYFDLIDELDTVRAKFYAQPWVKAILAARDADNRNKVAHEGREYIVSQTRYYMARKFVNRLSDNGRGDVRLCGYTLISGDN
jgi:hypothetical protein